MNFVQQVHDCTEHDDCHNIICINQDTGTIVWESHDSNTTDPTERVNPDYPTEDHRNRG